MLKIAQDLGASEYFPDLKKKETPTCEITWFNLWQCHRKLAGFNRHRLTPRIPCSNWAEEITQNTEMLLFERRILEYERQEVKSWMGDIPLHPKDFLNWFENLKTTGPGQNDPLFPWLAENASREEMKWFIAQEVAGEAGFDDLAALTQIKLPMRPKLEIARNYWDEMGRGSGRRMHGPLLDRVVQELEIPEYLKKMEKETGQTEFIVPESLALGNILLGMAINRPLTFHSIGALGAVELTAPGRSEKVEKGLERLGVSSEGREYFKVHAVLDVSHSLSWNQEVILPLIEQNPELVFPIAEGALMRLHAGARCFSKYRRELGLNV